MRFIPVLLLGFAVWLWAGPALADCTDPVGVEGDMTYNLTYKTMVFCDGTAWWTMKAANAGLLDNCGNDEILKWDGSGWDCAVDETGGAGGITALTGDVTGSGTGSVAATIADNAVTTAKTDFVGTLTEGKWCTVSGGDIVCTSDPPGGGGISQVTTATCYASHTSQNCTVSCPAGYFRTGCSIGVMHSTLSGSAVPSGSNGCRCQHSNSSSGTNCNAYCAQ